jgi:osmoprotectant transport system ATP-binding protein
MIALEQVGCMFDRFAAVADVTLTVGDGELVVLVGPSGCGKSTTLRMINRLIEHTSGRIRIDGTEIRSIQPDTLRRRMGYVIQSGGLFPHWTIDRNIAAVPALLGWPRARIRDRVTELMELVALDPVRLRGAFPHQLSGGQQQRVGVARALAANPDVLLMDEPFGALDPITRAALQGELARIHRDTRKTIVFVTHDMDEALLLADRIAVMQAGRLAQVGTPMEILRHPANDFVRDFVGGADDLGLKLLSVEPIAARLRAGETVGGAPLPVTAPLRRALSEMVARGTDRLAVVDACGRPVGAVHLADLARR